MLLDGGFGINIITKDLWKKLGLLIPRITPYTLRITDHIFTKHVRLIQDLKILIHGIPYVVTIIVMRNNVLDSDYSMLLEHLWLCNAKVTRDGGNNLITIEGNDTVQTIVITKHLDKNIKMTKVLHCYDFMNGITNKEEEVLLQTKLDLFTIDTITLLEPEMGTSVLTTKLLGVT